jgi:hypothetical protein
VTEQFTNEPFGEQSAPEPRFVASFERSGPPQQSEPVLQIIPLIDALAPNDLRTLSGYIHSKPFPVSHSAHPLANARRLTLTDRKSILYLSHYADPKGSRDEMAAIFGISRQRVSQIVGAIGCSAADQKLINLFNRTTPDELRNGWRVEAHVQKLNDFRERLIAARPVTPRHMTPSAVGRWSAYGRSFAVYERDQLFYFLINAPDEEESEPRASAQQALDNCFAACRNEAWANSSGDRNEWLAIYREDPFGPANKSNLRAV